MSNSDDEMKVLEVMQTIARGYDLYPWSRKYRRIPRMELVGMARAVCDRYGLTYSQRDLMDGEDEVVGEEAAAGEAAELEVPLVPGGDDADTADQKEGRAAVSADDADARSRLSSNGPASPHATKTRRGTSRSRVL